ncbi:hypothetical protein BJ138DRAFT_1231055 [Hygrophoropsis aurantiaca]|uniref:Uncharacterized protein n=1 Tax=Hygrophoropsis aurantiaca TaxID=72124 RepID=A0ACB7ZVT9_9AGAM|nr:hypothetical protein BJ138DRAFT_1231055 [Hygrophoropsis aurantiaca]
MNRDNSEQPFTDNPTPEEIRAFNPKNGRCCTAACFRVDLTGTPQSAWNLSAAQVFADSFCATHPGAQYSRETVCRTWIAYFDTLWLKYRKREADEKELEALANAQREKIRRKERKVNLYHRRYQTASSFSALRQSVLRLVKDVGVDGMSSDESSHEGKQGEATFLITCKPWRARSVTAWLRTLDSLHLGVRYKGQWKASVGAWPRIRLTSTVESESAAVPGLPMNFYSEMWLKTLSDFEKADLQPETLLQIVEILEDIRRRMIFPITWW